MPFNPNVYSGKKRKAQDVSQLMRDINALEGVKADETLTTTLTPQYGIIIGAGGALTEPRYCDVDSAGNIYVSDSGRTKVVKYTAAGNYVTEWGTIGGAPGDFQNLRGLSVDPSDNVWVVDNGRDVIIKFNSSGTYQTEWNATSHGDHTGIDTPADGYVYATVSTGVVKYNTSGVEQAFYSDASKIGVAWDIAVDANGIMYVAESTLSVGRPVKIDPSGPTYTNIGTLGSGTGQFGQAQGIAVDASGNIYTSDSTRDKVIIYDSTLTYVAEFGTSGTGVGQFTQPYGLCISLTGRILVPDATRGKVLQFSPQVAQSSGIVGVVQKEHFSGMGYDGYVYCFDRLNGLVKKRSTVLGSVSSFSIGTHLPGGTSPSIQTVSDGTIYMGGANAYVYKFNSSGVFQSQFAVPFTPIHLRADDSGNVYFASPVYGQSYLILRKYTTAGVSVASTNLTSGYNVLGIDVYLGNVYVLLRATSTSTTFYIAKYDTSLSLISSFSFESGSTSYRYSGICVDAVGIHTLKIGSSYGTPGLIYTFNTVGAVVGVIELSTIFDSVYYFPSSTVTGRLSVYNSIFYLTTTYLASRTLWEAAMAFSRNSSTYYFLNEIPDSVSSAISSPTDVVADATNLHITDTGNNRVIKYTKADGQYVSTFGSAGSGDGQFSAPKGIAKDSGGNIWVVDSGNSRVQKFTSVGVYSSKFGSAGSGNGQFSSPDRIHIDASDNIYITDKSNHRVQVFNSSGSFLRKFGTSGSANGNLSSPVGVAKNPVTGHVYVTNTANHRMEVFYEFDANTAKYVSRWGESGSGTTSRQFSSPEGVDVDDNGHMWVADTGNNRIARIAAHGKLSTFYGTVGSGDGNFSSPSGLSVYQNELYVVDRGNARIHKFLIGESAQIDSDVETPFTYYITPSGERSMGTPDRGVHVPDLGALAFPPSADELGDNAGVNLSATKYMTDMRTAVERLAASGVFTDGADGVAVDWSAGTPNLYKRALSGRHDLYGVPEADGASKRTWTQGALRKKPLADLDIGEIYETVRKLKETTWGLVS